MPVPLIKGDYYEQGEERAVVGIDAETPLVRALPRCWRGGIKPGYQGRRICRLCIFRGEKDRNLARHGPRVMNQVTIAKIFGLKILIISVIES